MHRLQLAALLVPAMAQLAMADHVVIEPPPLPDPVPMPGPNTVATTPPEPEPIQVADPIRVAEPSQPVPEQPILWMLEPVSRLELTSIPELSVLEPALLLDRGTPREYRRHGALLGQAALGAGRQGTESGSAAQLALAGGWSDRHFIVGARSDVTAFQDAIVRGHHAVLFHADNLSEDEDGLVGAADLTASLDHGEARGLAPTKLGTGKRDNGEVAFETQFRIGEDDKDGAWIVGMQGGLGATRWYDAPVDRALRKSVGMSIGMSPADRELPRGTFDLVRARIENATITRPIAALGPNVDAAVRLVEVGAGPRNLTLHIDREMVGVVDCDVGWVWLQSDTPSGKLEDDMFRMQLASHLKWRSDDAGRPRRLGLAVAREPGYTPDGQRLVSDWRLQLLTGIEDKRSHLDARGGISWVTPIVGDDPKAATLIRYGVQLEAGFKLTKNFELGAYHSQWFEPQTAGDQWASAREWTVESGVLARIHTN